MIIFSNAWIWGEEEEQGGAAILSAPPTVSAFFCPADSSNPVIILRLHVLHSWASLADGKTTTERRRTGISRRWPSPERSRDRTSVLFCIALVRPDVSFSVTVSQLLWMTRFVDFWVSIHQQNQYDGTGSDRVPEATPAVYLHKSFYD